MINIILSALAVAAVAPLSLSAKEPADSAGFVFTDVKVVPTNSVKDQNKSGTCWSFSGTSFIEDEILRKTGKSVDLSEMFTVRECYNDKADNYVRRYGVAQFSQGGACGDVIYVWDKYGAMPESAYAGLNYGEDNHVHGEVEAALKSYLDVINRKPNRRISTAYQRVKNGMLDAYFGEIPESFEYEGKSYTPKSFAASFPINPSDYINLTSFTHHPFYKPFSLEVSDNWTNDAFYNIPLDQLVETVEYAIEHGYSVAWGADVSERGFNWSKGYANMPKAKTASDLEGTELSRWVSLSKADQEKETYSQRGPVEEIDVTQDLRQEMFDRQETTDDHGMVIVGIATDQKGNKWFKVKNSWTDKQIYGGYFYVSIPYFKAKTMDIFINKEAVPANVLKELGLKK
ncbi:MAG: C1 family peptidase [Paramuribaculum sp.]|nr:C1 family peptidase [Paramuribaculum sp.]